MKTTHNSGINEFPISIDFFDKPEVCAVTIEHGIKGQAATIMLLCAIYRNGYFIEWKPENFLPILKELPGITINKMQKIVKTLVEWGFFDKEMFEQHQVLTSRDIQQHYFNTTGIGNQTVEDPLPYWLTDEEENSNEDTAQNENKVNTPRQLNVREGAQKLMENKRWVKDMCRKSKIEPTVLKEWLNQFASFCEKKDMTVYNNTDEMLVNFEDWMSGDIS